MDVKASFPRSLELKGFCPVTFKDGPIGFSSILPGDLDNVIEYNGKLYAMLGKEQLEKFTSAPWDYVDLLLPAKLPPPIAPISVNNLPLVGYLEQAVAKSLTEALTSVGTFKPKYPYKNLKRSACEYVGLYLKGIMHFRIAKNPKSKEWLRKSYEKRLDVFQNDCNLLISLTGSLNQADMGKDAGDDEFALKLDLFLKLSK